MVELDSIEIFISLLFVVIIEIGGVARSLDLERICEEKLPPFFIGLFFLLDTGSQQQQVSIPQLGRFNFLHGANLAILFLGFGLVVEATTGATGLLIGLVTYVVWAILPLLEIDEYEEILVDGYRPVSYYHHVIVVTLSAALIYSYDSIWNYAFGGSSLIKNAILIALCIGLFYIMLFGFLKNLERELDRVDAKRIPDKITKTNPSDGDSG